MASVRVKGGVQPFLIHIIAALSRVAARITDVPEVWITSGIDGTHSERSLHYALRAIDVRTKNFPTLASKTAFVAALKVELGPSYDVILEHVGKANEHVHIEFDPK